MSVYACSDLHGMKQLYDAIKESLKPEDKVFFLGDAGDRGPEPWETIKAILDDPQFIYIKGNHEDMLCHVLSGYLDCGCPDYHDIHLLSSNGGGETFDQAIADPRVREICDKLWKLPLIKEYKRATGERVVLSHAGFTPWKEEFFADDETKRDIIFHRPKRDDLLWDRDHFLDEWTKEDCVDCFIVHGHTPVPYLLEDIDPACLMPDVEPGALIYADGRKVCVDCGAVFTGYCVLLDLDTWEEKVFWTKPYL